MKPRCYKRQVDAPHTDMRLDQFLTRQPEIPSRAFAQRLITRGDVLINGGPASKHYHLKQGDLVTFRISALSEATVAPEDIALVVHYEDDALLVLSKPPGMVVHPVSPEQKGTLVNALLAYSRDFVRMMETEGEQRLRPGIVHRLDRDTSGIMIVAKNQQTRELLATAIKNREVVRTYLALVHGTVEMESGTIDVPLGKGYRNRTKVRVAGRSSRKAVTHFRVKERFRKYTLLEVDLETGRTHQIRVHLRYINHPIVGDQEYGYKKRREELALSRQFLHASRLEFKHPVTGRRMKFTDKLAPDLEYILRGLRMEEQA